MELVRIRHVDDQLSWTIVEDDEPVTVLRDWIVHLEELHFSPNTIEAYARHVARLGTYLKGSQNISGRDSPLSGLKPLIS